MPHFQFRDYALSTVPCFFRRAAQGCGFRRIDQQFVGTKSMDKREPGTLRMSVAICGVRVGVGELSAAGIAKGFNAFPGFG